MQAQTFQQSFAARLAGQHSVGLSISLHLIPGILTGLIYYLLAGPVTRLGLPSIVALMAAGVLMILPFELLIIACSAWGSFPRPQQFKDMIPYRQPIPFWQYLLFGLGILVVVGLLFTLMTPISNLLHGLFAWLPASMELNTGREGAFSRSTLIWVSIFNALLLGIIIPIVEELYFRGFLLPRMPQELKAWAPFANSFLFALYHTWSPWMLVARTVGLLPMIYFVQRKRNIYIGMIVHCLANLIDVFGMIAFIAAMH